jgi:hypothetical protein
MMGILTTTSQEQRTILTKALHSQTPAAEYPDLRRYKVQNTASRDYPRSRSFTRQSRVGRQLRKRKRLSPQHESIPGASYSRQPLITEERDALARTLSGDSVALTSSCGTDISRGFWAIVVLMLYTNRPELASRLLALAQADPVFTFLCLITTLLIQRCLVHVPKQISFLSDSSIVFEDVFGVEIRVPYQQCEQIEVFQGFLEYYFRKKPGFQRVIRRRYHLLLGDARGQILDQSCWKAMVKPRARLTMAMLLLSAQSQCAKCLGPLEPCSKGQLYLW